MTVVSSTLRLQVQPAVNAVNVNIIVTAGVLAMLFAAIYCINVTASKRASLASGRAALNARQHALSLEEQSLAAAQSREELVRIATSEGLAVAAGQATLYVESGLAMHEAPSNQN